MIGRAVSPVTSYLAIEPGVRPSTEGLEELGSFGQGFGAGVGRVFGSHRVKPVAMSTFDKHAFLARELGKALAACGVTKKASFGLESTRHELVDVDATIDGEKAGSARQHCVEDAAWEIDLPHEFSSHHQSFHLTIDPNPPQVSASP